MGRGTPARGTTEQDHSEEDAGRAIPWYRRLGTLVGVVAVAAVVMGWSLTSSVAPFHSANDIERPSREVATIDAGLHQLHGHLNHVVWNGGSYDAVGFRAAARRALEHTDDAVVTDLVDRAVRLADAGDHRRAHLRIEQAERRLIELSDTD